MKNLLETNENRTPFKRKNPKFIYLFALILFLSVFSFSQSTDQNQPTPVSTSQIEGQINARDIGDSRLTTYYFLMMANRGDVFINVVTSNLNGDIDIFTADGLNPRTKITIYADSSENETGRVVYMRQAEKLIVRIQGRTPNDDPAIFQIKFAGSFEPLQGVGTNSDQITPTVTAKNTGSVRVNSVGTIIEETPTPKSANTETVAGKKEISSQIEAKNEDDGKVLTDTPIAVNDVENKSEDVPQKDAQAENKTDGKAKSETKTENVPEISPIFDPTKKVDDIIKEAEKPPRVLISDSFELETKKNQTEPAKVEDAETTRDITVDFNKKKENRSALVTIQRVDEDEEAIEEKTETETNPYAKIFLKVELKNGERFERSMSEVLSMNVIKGVLTIVTNDGKIQEFSILEVARMVIE